MPLSPSGNAHWLPDRDVPLVKGPIGELLRRNARRWPDRPAIKWADGTGGVAAMSYAELLERAERFARWLLERVSVGDRIAVWSANRLEIGVMMYGSALAGTIMTAFNQAWTDAEASHAAGLAQPRLMFVGSDARGVDLRPRAEALASCPILDLGGALALAPTDAAAPLPRLAEDQPYVIQFTSGTTGRAKGALINQSAAIVGAILAYPLANLDENDSWLVYTPFHHVGATCSIPMAALACGGSYVLLERFDVDQIVRLIKPSGATQMSGIPTMWFDMVHHPDLPADARIRTVTLGGAAVPPAIGRAIESRTGARLSIVFALSESLAATRTTEEDDEIVRAETIGKPVPHAEVKIIDPESGVTLGFDEVGEICVAGPMVMDGYWGNAEATAATIDGEGFLHTGDLGSMDRDGTCRIRGRARELIIRGGENVYPIEVEDALLSHPAVALAGVIGLPHHRLGHEVAAVVQLKPGAEVGAEELRAHAAGLITHFKVPNHWRFVDAMPMTATAKVYKVGMEKLFKTTEIA